MIAQRIQDHVAASIARLLSQFRGRPQFEALVAAMAGQVQQLEDALFAIANCTGLVSGASGAQLDVAGALVGAQRQGLSDEQYQALIKGTIAQNQGDSTIENLLSIIRQLFGSSQVFLGRPGMAHGTPQNAGGTVCMAVSSPSIGASVLPQVLNSVKNAVGGGISVGYIQTFDVSGTFAFAGSQPWVQGFGSIKDANAGGRFGRLLLNQPAG